MKIENPTKWLEMLLAGFEPRTGKAMAEDVFAYVQAWRALHEHLRDGGALPEQWRGPWTAAGALRADAMASAALFTQAAESAMLESERLIAAIIAMDGAFEGKLS